MTSEIHTQTGKADGLAIRYAEWNGEAEAGLLLLSPWPESIYAWEQLWPRLATAGHVLAIDLPGFGHSEGRVDLFSPQAMGRFLIRLIDEWDLGAPHVFGPDVGGPAALDDYMNGYAGSRFGESARFVRNYPTDLALLEGLLPQIQTPVKIINSDHDPMVPLSNAEYLTERLPRCELTVLDAGQFAWEDQADAYGDAALAWLEGGYARIGGDVGCR